MVSLQRGKGGLPGPSAKRRRGRGSPAIQTRFSRFRGTIQRGPARRQKAQIVQSCMTLRDLLPGFWPSAIRVPSVSGSGSDSALPLGSWTAKPAATSSACLLARDQSRCLSDLSEPAPAIAPLDLVQAGLGIGEHPHPVAAPFAGAVGAPTSFRACHHSIPFVMDRTICAKETSRRKLVRARFPFASEELATLPPFAVSQG